MLRVGSDNQFFVDTRNNRVGINNAAPVVALDVAGTVQASDVMLSGNGTFTLPSYSFITDPDTGMFRAGAGQVALTSNGTEGYRMQSDLKHAFAGKLIVGNGTVSSPLSALEAVGSPPGIIGGHAGGQLMVRDNSTNVNGGGVITGHNSSGGGNQQVWYLGGVSGSNQHIAFINRMNAQFQIWTNNTSRMVIGADGGMTVSGNSGVSMIYAADGGLTFNTTTGTMRLNNHTTATRDGLTPTSGMILYNVTVDELQIFKAGVWVNILTG